MDDGKKATESETHYKLLSDFSAQPMLDFELKESSELWLIQWPSNHPLDFGGKEFVYEPQRGGNLGIFESSTEKQYDVVNFAAQDADAQVFFSAESSGSKTARNIKRRVSVHYPDPEELPNQKPENSKPFNIKLGGTTYTGSSAHLRVPTRSSISNPHLSIGNAASTHGSKNKPSASPIGVRLNTKKMRHSATKDSGSKDRSSLKSERGHSSGTSVQSRQQ